jgi:hypothetical protein
MATRPPDPLDVLSGDPSPVIPDPAPVRGATEELPRQDVERLMQLSGVDGVWVEHDAQGQPVVVIHYTPGGTPTHLPRQVRGMPTRIVGGEPIRAQR